ncbi:hypothetical protein D9611_010319 [Ephemerocybe angulata]|uniref:Xanthine/uracil permease n=1 Tax=Ephemerocybe angulata TaxID=980116 RepID=A0A8H5BB25_9AGAR|nr:hypothetical protein D9611_010319 [Tulosesus angulatus]
MPNKLTGRLNGLNNAVARSVVGRWFKLEGSGAVKERAGSRFTTELRAGLTTWISVNASILADTGGTCVCTGENLCVADPEYLICKGQIRNNLITATAAISALSTCLMGLLANLPVGLAPGLGLNAYFTYSVVGFHGSGLISYREALSAVFLEGWIFLILSLIGIRQWLVRIMPQSLILAVGAGIGLYIAFIGLAQHGLKVIGGDTVNLIGLGGCLAKDYASADLPGYCVGGQLRDPTMWLGIFVGGILTLLLLMYRVHGAILIGIFTVSIISWPRPTAVSYFPHTPEGDTLFDFFKQVVTFQPLDKIGNVLSYNYGSGHVWYALITFLYVDILDTTGTLYSMAKFAGLRDPETMDFENSSIAYCVDAVCISMGALMGISPVTAYIESATGISEGGKTGLTALTTGFMFFVSIFFAPIFASIPSWATGGALVIVGSMMIRNVLEINWDYIGDAVPAFLTLIIIPFGNNIAYGVIAGIFSYIILNGIPLIIRKASRGRIVPSNYDMAEPWVIPPGSMFPPWMYMVRNYVQRKRGWAPGGEAAERYDSRLGSEEEVKDKTEMDATEMESMTTSVDIVPASGLQQSHRS